MQEFVDSDRAIRLMQLLEARYEFLALLGRGGSGLVFEVENRQLGRREALKFLSHNFARDGGQRFANEAKTMAALEHPHIVPIYAFGEDEGSLWYSMRLVEGPPLDVFLKPPRRATVREVLQVAIPVLGALALIHERGVIHRDIKPSNILLDPQAGPLVTDFGVAKLEGDTLRTETGMMLGTPAYVSPEQSLGKQLDGRTDLYALGVSLFQILTGRLPFGGNSMSMFLQRLQEEAPALRELCPEVPEAVAAVIMRAMAREADHRYATALEMRDACIQAAEACGVDWTGPVLVAHDSGPRREALPTYLAPTVRVRLDLSERETSASPIPFNPTASTAERPVRTRKVDPAKVRIAILALLVVAGSAVLWLRRGPEAPAPVLPRPEPALAVAQPTNQEPTQPPKPSAPARNDPEPSPVRRAITPAQLVTPPRILRVEGGPCAGLSASVEVRVDEAGAVTSARLLSKVKAECAEEILKAAGTCRFSPALAADGQPVSSTVAIAIEL
jgi:serine/threonine-protein kinase